MSHTPHPQMRAILDEMHAAPAVDPRTLPIAEARAAFERNNIAANSPLPPMQRTEVSPGDVPCALVTPPDASPGLIVFVHGGGWTFGSPATHDRFARLLALEAGVAVLSPDYRLAPEHPCPAAIEDVLAVLAHLADVPHAVGPVALCGDSAGANIALGTALNRPAVDIVALSLLYGCFAPIFDTPSHQRNGDGQFGLSTDKMRWYWANWLGAANDPRAAPLEADLAGLPRTHLLAAALDPLCDDSLLMAERMARHGVAVRLDVVPGVIHGFLQMTARLEPAMKAAKMIGAELRSALGTNQGTDT
jgi:acetyl esterase